MSPGFAPPTERVRRLRKDDRFTSSASPEHGAFLQDSLDCNVAPVDGGRRGHDNDAGRKPVDDDVQLDLGRGGPRRVAFLLASTRQVPAPVNWRDVPLNEQAPSVEAASTENAMARPEVDVATRL